MMEGDKDMNGRTRIRLALIGVSGLALATAMPAQAQTAQDTPATAPQTAPAPTAEPAPSTPDAQGGDIVVTGFRSSLANALNIKRETAGVVDVIKAEDIAAFPDQNLAESLQRIPGVAITRIGGEGRQISVRGLGPEYTRVRVNGMEALATSGGSDSGGAVGSNRGRGFDFNIFASELFNSLVVHKTGSADIEEGSLGATVDLNTGRPFDYTKPQLVLSAQGSYNDLSKRYDPRLAGLFTKTFFDGKLGVLLTVAYNERHAIEEVAGTTQWGLGGANGGFSPASTLPGYTTAQINSNDPATGLFHPRNPSSNSYNENEKRLGITGGIQFKPTDRTLISLNGMYGRLAANRTEHLLQAISFSRSGSTGKPQTVINDGVVDDNNNLIYGQFSNVDMRAQESYTELTTTFQQYTADISQDIGSNFKLTAMAGYAKSVFDSPIGTTVTYEHLDTTYSYDYRNNPKVPAITMGFNPADPSQWATIPGFSALDLVQDRVANTFKTGKIGGDWTIASGWHIRGGADYRKFDFSSFEAMRVPEETDVPVLTPAQLASVSDVFSGYGRALPVPSGNPTSWIVPNIAKYAKLFNIYSGTGLFQMGSIEQSDARGSNFAVSEEDLGGWLQATFDQQFLGMTVRGDVGIRYYHTRQYSNGYAAVGDSIQLVEATRNYEGWLPSINMVFEPTDKFLIRLGLAKTIARPSLGSLTPGGDISVQGGNRSFSSGNPDLAPTTSKNVDLSFEWYPTSGAIYSVGLFYKNISTFVQTLRQTVPFNTLGLPDSLLAGTIATPTDLFDVSQPVDSNGGTLKGLELNIQQPLKFLPGFLSNFGVLLNYTYVDSDIQYLTSTTPGAPTVRSTLVGLSKNAANATLYYETKKFSIRGSVSYRSGYLTTVPGRRGNDVEGANSTLNVDARASYNVLRNVQLSIEAINLTNQPDDRYVDTANRPWLYSFTGRQLSAGVRVTF
jgi:TonB-dependent receptor